MAEILLQMENIQKYFTGVHALDDAFLSVNYGEVHALVGENGAGKSTLMKILNGIYKKDGGRIIYKGKEVEIDTPQQAQSLGIGMIHQELNLMPHLTVAENIFIGKEPLKGVFLDKKRANIEAGELLRSLNIEIDPAAPVNTLSVAKQQMVEIAKALSYNSELLVMDEPSAALTENEIQELFKFIRNLKNKGNGIIYISHRLDELPEIADRVTVMRDGQYIGSACMKDITKQQIISMMVGRTIYEEPKTKSSVPVDAPVVLDVRELTAGYNVKKVSFTLRKGEILGFAGLMGAGRTETMRALFGADPVESGDIFVNGQKVRIKSPSDAIKHGIGYLSEDRKGFGLAVGLSVRDNCVMTNLEEYTKNLLVDDKRIQEVTEEYIDKIAIKTPSTMQLVKNLSGGNQQKIVVAKWLIRNCDILIFDEPTRGIDVGAKSEIYKLMTKLTEEENKSIIMISSDMPELLRMSDRIMVMCEGRITGELDISEVSQEQIMALATMNM
ncbi:MAG: Galactose/methyl galactoside import ATP-binding protein MglA [Firmicutes bacterium ADurb.Bin182]|nr:MAG: Galactose/methyl galactoside import ATP-binding protein MglA [Firmicutes bacterium ADurb.Bin182]